MASLLGMGPLAILERVGVVFLGPVATRYPCSSSCPENCPRDIIDNGNGTCTALCPIEPDVVALPEEEARVLRFDPHRLVEVIRQAVGITGRVEWLKGLPNTCRLGAHVPTPGTRFPIFFVARCSQADYGAVFDVLLAQTRGTPFAAMVPTHRHIAHDTERRLADAGCVLIVLADVLRFEDEGLRLMVGPARLFERLGQVPVPDGGKATAIARAIVGRRGRFSWLDLDEAAYERLRAERETYDVFADEHTRSCFKRGKTTRGINRTYFATIRAAMDRRSKYDPVQDGPGDRVAAQQTFQRARKTFDIGQRKTWKIFKTDASGEVTRYDFSPDPDVSFVFIFTPSK